MKSSPQDEESSGNYGAVTYFFIEVGLIRVILLYIE
jgi:hypothetical protein